MAVYEATLKIQVEEHNGGLGAAIKSHCEGDPAKNRAWQLACTVAHIADAIMKLHKRKIVNSRAYVDLAIPNIVMMQMMISYIKESGADNNEKMQILSAYENFVETAEIKKMSLEELQREMASGLAELRNARR